MFPVRTKLSVWCLVYSTLKLFAPCWLPFLSGVQIQDSLFFTCYNVPGYTFAGGAWELGLRITANTEGIKVGTCVVGLFDI